MDITRRSVLVAGASVVLPAIAVARPPAGEYRVRSRGVADPAAFVLVSDGEPLPMPFKIGEHQYAGMIFKRRLSGDEALALYCERMRGMGRLQTGELCWPGFITARLAEPVQHLFWTDGADRDAWIRECWAPPGWDGWETTVQCIATEWQPCSPSA